MKKRFGFYFLLLALIAVLAAAIAAGGAWYWVNKPMQLSADRVDFVVDPGATPRAIARTLNEAGVPVWEPGFVWLARLSERDKLIKAGGYQAINGDSPWLLLERLARAGARRPGREPAQASVHVRAARQGEVQPA